MRAGARLAGLAVLSSSLAACADKPVLVHDVILQDLRTESVASFIRSLNVARSTFRPGDAIVIVADATWSEPTNDGGRHAADWRLYGDGRLLKERRATETLSGRPAQLVSHISGGTLPPGRYRAALSLDHGPTVATAFEIIPSRP